jgi:hypothetical protein
MHTLRSDNCGLSFSDLSPTLKYQTAPKSVWFYRPLIDRTGRSRNNEILIPSVPPRDPRRRPTRQLRLMSLHILLGKRRTDLLMRLVVRLLAVFVAVESAMTFVAILQRVGAFATLCTCFWLLL